MNESNGGAPVSGDSAGDSQSEGDNLLLELVERLLSIRYPGHPHAGAAKLLVGQVAPQVSDLPLPGDRRVIGSQIQPYGVTVVLDTNMSPEEVTNFYREHMTARDWKEPQPWRGLERGGFEHSFFRDATGVVFCAGPKGPELRVEVYSPESGPTEVRLHYNTSERNSTCSQMKRMQRMQKMGASMWWSVIPSLEAPAGSVQVPSGGGGSSDTYSETTARLVSDLDLQTISAHYRGQLKKGGWQETDSSDSEQMAWSTFTFKNKDDEQDWQAVFFVIKFPGRENQYYLFVHASVEDTDDYPGVLKFFRR